MAQRTDKEPLPMPTDEHKKEYGSTEYFQYVKKDPSPGRAQNRLAERRRRKKEEHLARLVRELKRKEARLRQREKDFEQKKRQSWTARNNSPAAQDDWRSSGSGFYLKDSTHIMTNFHVIEKAKSFKSVSRKGTATEGASLLKIKRMISP